MPLQINPNTIRQAALAANASDRMNNGNADLSAAQPPAGMNVRPPSNALYRMGQGSVLAGQGLDTASTLQNLATGRFREADPQHILGTTPKTIIPMKAAITAGSLYGMKKLKDAGHDKLAGMLGMLSAVPPMIAGVNNIRARNAQ